MKYNGIELTEFTSDKPVIFDPPRKMLVWDTEGDPIYEDMVDGYFPNRSSRVLGTLETWAHCAEIPEETKPRLATNRELAKWLAQGNGEWRNTSPIMSSRSTDLIYTEDADPALNVHVRKWDDAEWHEPTVDYMGLEG